MEFYQKNKIFIWVLALGVFFYLIYLSMSSVNVPLMDYWKYIDSFVEKMNTGGVSFADIWRNDGIHRSPLQFIYFILNVRLFHLNAHVEIYLGAIVMALIIVILYRKINLEVMIQKPWQSGIIGIGLVLIVFNLNQWEIMNKQFALSFSSRIIIFITSFILTSAFLQKIEQYKKYTIELGIMYIIVIELVAGGYFPAYIASIAFTVILHYLLSYKEQKNKYLKEYLILITFLAVGAFIYLNGMFGETSVISLGNLQFIDLIKKFVTGIFIMLGVCIFGFSHSQNITILLGGFVFIFFVLAFIIFFKKKYFKRTYLPVLFLGYSAGAMGIIYLGRLDMYGVEYAYSSRYVCETNVALLGFYWIVVLVLSELRKEKGKKRVIKSFAIILSTITIFVGVLSSYKEEWAMAPYRKEYGEGLIQNIYNIELLTEEDFSRFQSSEEYVRKGIDTMKKYNLGVFYYNRGVR